MGLQKEKQSAFSADCFIAFCYLHSAFCLVILQLISVMMVVNRHNRDK